MRELGLLSGDFEVVVHQCEDACAGGIIALFLCGLLRDAELFNISALVTGHAVTVIVEWAGG